ncbi:MAG: hypothetical protein WBG50_05740 [Desulfomonilaceae bacterium]
MARFFDSINQLLGVKGPGELVVHPVFIGCCVVAFIYAVVTRMKYFALAIAGLMGGTLIFRYLYPENTADLGALLTFVGAMGILALLLVYLGFIRE